MVCRVQVRVCAGDYVGVEEDFLVECISFAQRGGGASNGKASKRCNGGIIAIMLPVGRGVRAV